MQVKTFPESQSLISPALEPLHILIVDDDPAIRETLQFFLQRIGIHNVQTAENGVKALEKINQARYNYAFIDLMMPEMNGMEVLKNLQKNQHLISVIVMTGYPSMEIVVDAMHNGASDFLIKPFRFQDVKLSMERIQMLHLLMEKNFLLNQELEKKKEVEDLNIQLENRIRLQSILYNITDSLSKINRSEDLYDYIVKKAVESCNAKKACFMIYDQENSSLLALAQVGLHGMDTGAQADMKIDSDGQSTLDRNFIKAYFENSNGKGVSFHTSIRNNGFMAMPFKIRKEPFGMLLVAEKEEKTGFDREDEFILGFLAEKTALNIENIALYENLKQSLIATLMSLVSAIEAKDPYTQQHSSRVTEYALKIACNMGYGPEDLQSIESSGPLHDIGKIGINDSILNKPGRLTEEEFKQIKTHPLIGVNIVSPLGLDQEEQAIIRNHHERWDGNGYPDGLKGENIPAPARILAVADAFDAMSSSRAYRDVLPLPVCLQELKDNSGSQFDPQVVKAALPVLVS